MQNITIDINVDVGEGIGNETLLMPHISSCNIACGGHAGNLETMRYVVKLAKQYQVKIGAHPSFPDKDNFGRIPMQLTSVALYTSLKDQINDLMIVLKEEQARLNHIKLHGALYNIAAVDTKIAGVIIEVMKSFILPIKLYVPYHSAIETLAINNNIPIMREAFADRNYNGDGSLVSRTKNNAIIDDVNEMFEHVYRMIISRKVKTITGTEIDMLANTFCIHGDHSQAVFFVKYLVAQLAEKGIEIR
ncbi:MAG: 5-oxoprolinase subunit PxpA [Flavobacteriaceae bacterium]|nr:5-oxoprolinase subunit PxpA [Flavobacteriaceae bacterium]